MGNAFRKNVRDELEFQGITAKELAEKTEIPYQTMANYLNARASMPPADYACRIARALHTTVEQLVGTDVLPRTDESTRQNSRILAMLNRLPQEDKKAFIQLLTTITRR